MSVDLPIAQADATRLTPEGPAGVQSAPDSLFQCLAWVAAWHGDERSVTAWRQGVPHDGQAGSAEAVIWAAEQAGYVATLVERDLRQLPDYVLPAIVLLAGSQAAVLIARHDDGTVDVALPEGGDQLITARMPMDQLVLRNTGFQMLLKPRMRQDARAGTPTPHGEGHWFWSNLLRFRSYYANTALAAVLINVLTLAGTFFTMNVYDRVVPSHSYPTLWTLGIGTLLAMTFEFATRLMRSHLVDAAGKKVDLTLGSLLFRQALAIRLERRPASSGAFANRFREFESVREFTTSATVAALTDLPFALLFLAVIIGLGGVLAWVPALAIMIIVLAAVVIQWPLARHMKENLREASLKHGLLVESLEGIETIKAVNGQSRMQKSWEDYSAVAAQSYMKSRALSSMTLSLVSYVQQVETVVLIIWGVYLIHAGSMSQGALIAVVMLARQVVSPLGQVVGLALRFQQAKAAMQSLNQLMKEPTDEVAGQNYLAKPRFSGGLRTSGLQFFYPDSRLPAINNVNLSIKPGEKVAILGRIGSGKSTLLRLLNSLYLPTQGAVLADDIDQRQINPADIHHNIGLVAQDCKLFYGSLRDNLTIGATHVSAQRLVHVCKLTGLDTVIARHPQGIDMMLGEGGSGLSVGQRQLVALARCLLSDPTVLLLDEPTSSMDSQTESAFIAQLKQMNRHRTVLIATHRMSLLDLVDRVIVLDQGQVIADGPKDQLIKLLTSGAGIPINKPAHTKAASHG
jgi:ATP-binding cassette subfamily C protein LapB